MMRNRLLPGVLALTVGAFVFAPAAAAEQRVDVKHDGKYCAILVSKAPEGVTSPVLAKACSDVSMAQAEAAMNAQHATKIRAQGVAAVASGIPIMYWYEHIDYNNYGSGGGASTTIYGNSGPCDAAGYRVAVYSPPGSVWWAFNMSSIAGNNNCYTARVYNIAKNDVDSFNIHVGGRGHFLERFNDNVGLIQVHS